MKKLQRILPLFLILCLFATMAGCQNDASPETTVPPTTAEPTTVPTTLPPPDPAQLYEAGMEAFAAAASIDFEISRVMTVGGQTFTTDATQTVNYWNIGGEEFLARVQDMTDYGEFELILTELFIGGNIYQNLGENLYTAESDPEDFMARYPAVRLLDPQLYSLALEENDTVIRFTDATAVESWLAGEDAQLISAEATVTLGSDGTVTDITYQTEYTYGPAHFQITCTAAYHTPGKTPDLPENTDDYIPIEDIDGMWLLDSAFGYLLQAKQYSSEIHSSVQSEAAGFILNHQYSMDSYVTDSGTDYRLQSSTYAMDSTGDFEQDLDEKFISGSYSIAIDDGEETPNPGVTAAMMESYISDLFIGGITDASVLSDAVITDIGSLLLIEYTCTEEQALTVCEGINMTLFNQADLLHSLSSNYTTNKMDYYLAVDKYTLLPTACGYAYEGCHTIEGYDCLLTEQLDQSFDLASLTSHDAIYEEPSPDTEPEEKPTPLFYHVTGPEGQEMWLFGTIHVGDDRTAFLPQEVYDALLSSTALAVECDTEGFNDAVEEDEDLQSQVSACYFYKGGTIADHLDTEDLHEDAVQVMKATGSYFYNSEYLKASLWSSSIDNYYLSQGHSLVSEKGLESRLEKLAEENDIPLWEVESSLFQIQMLTGYSDYLQEFQLYSSVYSHGKDSWEGVAELYELWCEGDEAKLIEEMKREAWAFTEEDLEETEDMDEEDLADLQYIRENMDSINAELEKIYNEYIKSMESDRNAGMLKVAKQYLESGDTVFFAVGLAHLIAEDGLVFTLRDAGYTVELVQYK